MMAMADDAGELEVNLSEIQEARGKRQSRLGQRAQVSISVSNAPLKSPVGPAPRSVLHRR